MHAGDEARIRCHRRTVVAGRIRHVHRGQLADDRLVLEDRLEDPLAHLGLVGRVRREKLAARQEGIDDRGDVVVVDPHPEEAQLTGRIGVPRGELLQVADECRFRQRPGDVELAAEPDALRDLREQLVE